MTKVLIVEDDEDLANTVAKWLKLEKFVFDIKSDGEDALQHLRYNNYDAIILDLGLPGMGGLELLKQFRANGGLAPVLILTGKNKIEEKEAGLDAGADDYLTKPFDARELLARIRALLRRPVRFEGQVTRIQEIELNRKSHLVTRGDKVIDLLPKEFDLLEFFMRHPGQIFNAEALLERIWPATSETSPDVVRTHMNRLRRKLMADNPLDVFETVHGVGYKLNN